MSSADQADGPSAGVGGQSPGKIRVSFQNDPVIDGDGGGGCGALGDSSFPPTPVDVENDSDVDDEDGSSSPPAPLHNSSRLKGYITLFVSAIYNFLAAAGKSNELSTEELSKVTKTCLSMDDLGNFVQSTNNSHSLKFAMACSMITVIITCAIILCHLDFCTPLRKNVWPKAFGPNSKIELCILLSLTLFWFISTWFNTTIRGPAGEGTDQFNLYFSNWICCWACFWTLERWSTTSGRASFRRFVQSWPNRCPLWILTFLLSLCDFLFTLDTYRNWEEGTKFNPYVYKMYSEVRQMDWTLLFFVTTATFAVSFAWVLAEIFRESRTNVESVKSDVENYVEGLTAHVLATVWILTVFIVTMPGGAASLIGNLYFTTWSTLFAVISTLIWWIRDWRQGIKNVIREEEEKYELTKASIRRREEKRLARLAEKEAEESEVKSSETNAEESKNGDDDDATLCQDDPVDDDITISISSDYNRSRLGTGASSFASRPDRPNAPIASSGADPLPDSNATASTSVLMSVLSFLYPLGADKNLKESDDV